MPRSRSRSLSPRSPSPSNSKRTQKCPRKPDKGNYLRVSSRTSNLLFQQGVSAAEWRFLIEEVDYSSLAKETIESYAKYVASTYPNESYVGMSYYMATHMEDLTID